MMAFRAGQVFCASLGSAGSLTINRLSAPLELRIWSCPPETRAPFRAEQAEVPHFTPSAPQRFNVEPLAFVFDNYRQHAIYVPQLQVRPLISSHLRHGGAGRRRRCGCGPGGCAQRRMHRSAALLWSATRTPWRLLPEVLHRPLKDAIQLGSKLPSAKSSQGEEAGKVRAGKRASGTD